MQILIFITWTETLQILDIYTKFMGLIRVREIRASNGAELKVENIRVKITMNKLSGIGTNLDTGLWTGLWTRLWTQF